MKKLLAILFLFISQSILGQIMVSPSNIDFGTVHYWKNDTVWFNISNTSSSKALLLPINYQQAYRVLPAKKKLLPGESMKIGLISYTNKTGKFEQKVPVYFSNSNAPIYLKIKGQIKSFDPSSMAICPTFNTLQDLKILVEIIFINAETKLAIIPDKQWIESELSRNSKLIRDDSIFKITLRKGNYSVIGAKKDYDDGDKSFEVKPGMNRIYVPMIPLKKEVIPPKPKRQKVTITFINSKTKRAIIPDQKWIESELDNKGKLIRKDTNFNIELPIGSYFAIGKKKNYGNGDQIFNVTEGENRFIIPMVPKIVPVKPKRILVTITFIDSKTKRAIIPDQKWIESELDNKGKLIKNDSNFSIELPVGTYFAIGKKKDYGNGDQIFTVSKDAKNFIIPMLPLKSKEIKTQEKFDVEIVFIDSETKRTIIPDKKWVESELNNNAQLTLMDSTFSIRLPVGNYFAVGNKEKYTDGDKRFEVKKGINRVIVPMSTANDDTSKVVDDKDLDENYALNNLVFLIDVSGSMKREAKMDQLKESMKYLVSQLRKNDQITIITFSYRAKVKLPPISGDNKDSIMAVINRLTPKGESYGSNAMEMAYEKATNAFIKGGNNQVILSTDGVFSNGKTSKSKVLYIIRKGRLKGISLSTLGFGEDKKGLNYLRRLSNHGGGDYVKITKNYNQVILVDMIKNQSKK